MLRAKLSLKPKDRNELANFLFCSNLDETTRAIYKENIRLNEALTYHLKEADKLAKVYIYFYYFLLFLHVFLILP